MRPPPQFRPHPFAYHAEVELRVDSLNNAGAGVGRIDGWVVFVAFALPGELVRARIFRNHKNYSEADLVQVLEASLNRVGPRCPLFGECGGCQYQHLAYPAQLEWKRRQVTELLDHLGGMGDLRVEPAIGSPLDYGYRSKLTPHFDKPVPDRPLRIGFLRHGRRFEIVDVPQCSLATEAINRALAEVRRSVHLDSARFRRGATLLLRGSAAGVSTDPSEIIEENVEGLRMRFPAGLFFQNNPSILPLLTRHVAGECRGARYLVDAYCGSGLFALSCAGAFESVWGVEISAPAVESARTNAAANQIENCEFLCADAAGIFSEIPVPGGECAVIIDPPRKGSDEAFLAQLTAFAPGRIVYVSCNPATQIRDLKPLVGAGYRIVRIQPFDLFPQTKHLECVVTLHGPHVPAEPVTEQNSGHCMGLTQ